VIRILLVEPMNLLRGALAVTLSLEDDFEVVGDLGCLDEALALSRVLPPDVAVVGGDLLTDDGLRAFNAEQPGCATLVLAGPDEPAQLSRALDLHAEGVVNTQARPAELAGSIRQLVRGERVIDPGLAVAVLAAPPNPLSPRERDVLSVVASGAPAPEVASRLHLTHGTVRNYISAIIRKTGARNRLEAVRVAEGAGWLR
jgi:two-component system, NarL family, response regulator DesR